MKWNLKPLQPKKPAGKKPSKKALLISGTAAALVLATVAGIVLLGGKGKEPVGVYPFTMVGMDGYWGDSQESYGPVSTDKIQTVYLSDTQTVTQVLVNQGDTVKKGDVLMNFDTSLSDLQLERKRLEVEKLKLELDAAKAELKTIQGLKPMEPMPDFTLPETPIFLGATLAGDFKTYIIAGHDGKSMETAFVCWIREDGDITDAFLETLRREVWKDDGKCGHGDYTYADCPIHNCTHGGKDKQECEFCNECLHGIIEATCGICNPEICKDHAGHHPVIVCPECDCVHGEPRGKCGFCNPTLCHHGDEFYLTDLCPVCHPKCSHDNDPKECNLCICVHGERGTSCRICYCEHGVLKNKSCDQCDAALVPPEPDTETQEIAYSGTPYRIQLLADQVPAAPATGESYYVIFKATSGNTEMGPQVLWQGAHVQGKGKGFNIRYFTPFTGDYTIPEIVQTPIEIPDYDPGSGMTAAQIAQLRSDQELKIKELTLKHKMANADYKIMFKELGDGHVYAEFDGTVASILTEEEAKSQKQPVLKLSGGGGFFIQGSVSELEKDKLIPGQEVTVNDWGSGGMYTGTVQSIGDFPSADGYWNGAGNPNTTYYPFTVFVGEEASLQAGAYVNIQYSTSEAASGLYLDKAFLRTEKGTSYVYVRGADGSLEKRLITTGKTLWGSYVEVKSGLTVEDYIAFPYGKDVKSGAPTRESDLAELYGY